MCTPDGEFKLLQGHARLQAQLQERREAQVLDVTSGVTRTLRLDEQGRTVVDRTADAAAAMHLAHMAMARAFVSSLAAVHMAAKREQG